MFTGLGLIAVAFVSLLLIGWRVSLVTAGFMVLVILGALVGLLVIGWATAGGGAAAISSLFDRVIQSVIDRV